MSYSLTQTGHGLQASMEVMLPKDDVLRATVFGQIAAAWSVLITTVEGVQRRAAEPPPARPWAAGLLGPRVSGGAQVMPGAPTPNASRRKHRKAKKAAAPAVKRPRGRPRKTPLTVVETSGASAA